MSMQYGTAMYVADVEADSRVKNLGKWMSHSSSGWSVLIELISESPRMGVDFVVPEAI